MHTGGTAKGASAESDKADDLGVKRGVDVGLLAATEEAEVESCLPPCVLVRRAVVSCPLLV